MSGARGTGAFTTTTGLTVVFVFLLFAVQLLFGLYARTTVTAVAADMARRAANDGPTALTPGRLDWFESELRRRLGGYGDDASVDVRLVDADSDGNDDTVSVRVVADLPTLLPRRLVPASPSRFTRTQHARLETFQEQP